MGILLAFCLFSRVQVRIIRRFDYNAAVRYGQVRLIGEGVKLDGAPVEQAFQFVQSR